MKTLVFAASAESEAELVEMGFKKQEVWVHDSLAFGNGGGDAETKAACDRKMFAMKKPPYMFVTTSWWGMGVD